MVVGVFKHWLLSFVDQLRSLAAGFGGLAVASNLRPLSLRVVAGLRAAILKVSALLGTTVTFVETEGIAVFSCVNVHPLFVLFGLQNFNGHLSY